MRWVLLVLLAAGCEADAMTFTGAPPSAPPPVDVPAGTLVQQTWQFANPCQAPLLAKVMTSGGDLLDGALVPVGEVVYVEVRCAVGAGLVLEVDGRWAEERRCTPGTLPVRTLACQ